MPGPCSCTTTSKSHRGPSAISWFTGVVRVFTWQASLARWTLIILRLHQRKLAFSGHSSVAGVVLLNMLFASFAFDLLVCRWIQ